MACGCGASAPSAFRTIPMVPPVYSTSTLDSFFTSRVMASYRYLRFPQKRNLNHAYLKFLQSRTCRSMEAEGLSVRGMEEASTIPPFLGGDRAAILGPESGSSFSFCFKIELFLPYGWTSCMQQYKTPLYFSFQLSALTARLLLSSTFDKPVFAYQNAGKLFPPNSIRPRKGEGSRGVERFDWRRSPRLSVSF